MKLETDSPQAQSVLSKPNTKSAVDLRQFYKPCRNLLVFALVLAAGFAKPLFELAVFAAHSELFSHILLVPFITGYLIWSERARLASPSASGRALAAVPFLFGLAVLLGFRIAVAKGWVPPQPDYLACLTLAFVLFLFAGALVFLGKKCVGSIAFPVGFLLFCVPFPASLRNGLEVFFQHGSADVAYVLLKLSGMPVYRNGTIFRLPGFSMEVAPECSGIHSSLVLVITSLLAGYLFLKSPWKRLVLVAAIIPLALLRNGFRVFVIGQLCVREGPQMIDSPIHRHGGPFFFALSLVPLFLLLLYLRKRELRSQSLTVTHSKE